MLLKNICCTNWLALVPSIQEAKREELKDVKPSYLVEPVLTTLNNINKHCPVCGGGLTEETINSSKKKVGMPPPPKVEVTPLRAGPCKFCKGKGKKSDDTVCTTCMGTGDVRNGVQKKITREID